MLTLTGMKVGELKTKKVLIVLIAQVVVLHEKKTQVIYNKIFKNVIFIEGLKTLEEYIPEVRSTEELFNEDMANSEFYKIVPDDDEEISIAQQNMDHIRPIEYKILNCN